MKRILILSMLFLTACASTDDRHQTEVDEMHKQIRQLKRERDAAREDYDADVSRAFRREQLDRRFPYSGMPDAPDWQKRRSEEADRAEDAKRFNQANTIQQVSTPYGYFPVQSDKRPSDATCTARPVYTMDGKVVGYKRSCEGFDH